MKPDYLIVGSGLSALTFGALMTNSGKTVQILEAHDAITSAFRVAQLIGSNLDSTSLIPEKELNIYLLK